MGLEYFTNLSAGQTIFWGVLGCIFLFSIYAAITTKGKEGGIAAGVVTALAIHFSVIMQSEGLMKWLRSTKEWYIVVAELAGFILGMAVFVGISMAAIGAKNNKGFLESFLAVLFRIIGIAGCVVILLFAISQINSGGVIFY